MNDNVPTFSLPEYVKSDVPEDIKMGQIIQKVSHGMSQCHSKQTANYRNLRQSYAGLLPPNPFLVPRERVQHGLDESTPFRFQVTATDADSGENSEIIYQLDNDFFNILSTGEIRVAK